MKKVLVDTNIYSLAMRGDDQAISIFRRNERLLFSPVVIGELLNGFKGGKQEEKNRWQLKRFLAQPRIEELVITSDTSEFYASILEALRKQGTPIPTNDIWIAASAMENGAALATTDAHFHQVKGLILLPISPIVQKKRG